MPLTAKDIKHVSFYYNRERQTLWFIFMWDDDKEKVADANYEEIFNREFIARLPDRLYNDEMKELTMQGTRRLDNFIWIAAKPTENEIKNALNKMKDFKHLASSFEIVDSK